MVAHFRLLTLGAPLLLTAAGDAVRYRTRKHFALLIRLALEPGKRFARDYLVDLLWPNVSSERGHHSLSQAVSVLRATIGRQYLQAPRTTLALVDGVIDVDAHRLETGNTEIRGKFLEGFELRGTRGFEEWRDAWAARLEPSIRDCLVKRMDAGRRIGDFATVEKHALFLQDLDPQSEDAVRGIIDARAWVGDHSNALRVFDRFAERMADVNRAPSPELIRVVSLLRQGRQPALRPTADGVPPREQRRFEAETIIGREREFSVLYDAWLDARRGTPHLMVLLGDPGIGKTTLTNAFVSCCQMEGGIIARAQAYDAERELPYAVLAELARQLAQQHSIGAAEPEALADLARLAPEILTIFPGVPKLVDWPPEVVPLRLADAFLKAVGAAAEDNPVVLVVDDVHAADSASVAILHMLARKLAGLRLLLILTARPGDVRTSAAARALITDAALDALSSIELDTLPVEAATVLVARASANGRERWGEPPVAKVVRLGGGNPLALELLSREWVARGEQSLIGSMDALNALPAPPVGLPQTLKAVYKGQRQLLDDQTRAVLDLAAVLGRRMSDLRFYDIIGCTQGEALSRLTQLLETRLLREIGGQIEFRNELVRAHAYYEIPSTLRLELHRRVGQMLEQLTEGGKEHALEIAWHYIIGRDNRRAARHALTGAERTLIGGAAREAELVLRALGNEDLDPGEAKASALILAGSLVRQSKAEEAPPLLEEVLADSTVTKRETARAARLYASAMYLLNRNSTAKYSEMAERALQVARECDDNDLLAHALFESGRAGVESGNLELTRSARDELRRKVVQHDDSPPPMAFHAEAYCSYYLLDIQAASESAQKAVTALSKSGQLGELAAAYTGLGNCELALARFDAAREAYESALRCSDKIGDDCRTSITCSNLGASFLIEGKVEQAINFGEKSLAFGRRAPSQPALLRTWSNLAHAYLLAGWREKAQECLESIQGWIKDGRSWAIRTEYYCESASLELAFGNKIEALSLLSQAEQQLAGSGYSFVAQGMLDRLMVFLAYHTKGPDVAHALAAEAVGRYRDRNLLAYLDGVSALAWTEMATTGQYVQSTEDQLALFESYRAGGKKQMLQLQGFLP